MTICPRFSGRLGGICMLLALAALMLPATEALAQRPGAGRNAKDAPRENITGTGKVAQLAPGVLGVVGEGGEQWMVKLPNKAEEFAITGKAERGFLRAGMWVEFEGTVGKRGQVNEPVKEMLIFTPRPGYEVGIGPNTPAASGGASAGLFTSPEPEEKPKKAPKPSGPEEPMVYRIAAEITKVGRKGEITVGAGGVSLKADVAEDVKIKVDVADLGFISVGDKVEFQGWYYAAAKNQVYATSVTVTAAQTFTDGKKSKVKPAAKGADGDADSKEEKGSGDEKGAKSDDEKAGTKGAGKEAAGKEKEASKDAAKEAEKKSAE